MATEPGYQSPSVNVTTSLPKSGVDSSVLLVPVVSTGDEDKPGAVVSAAGPFLTAEAVAEIEAGLRALEATGASEQVHRLVVPSLPVASVLTVGLGKLQSEWPADTIRRAAGVAARSLGGAEVVITTLAALPGEDVCSAAVEGLILGAYRFTAFRSDKTAPKDKGLGKITMLTASKDAKKHAAHGAAVAAASPPSRSGSARTAGRCRCPTSSRRT